jgi:flagellar hook-basal body complex protein FliE
MCSITLNIPGKEYDFFMRLVNQLDFVTINKAKNAEKSKEEFLEGLKEAVEEVNLAKKGKVKLKSAEQLLNELVHLCIIDGKKTD